MLQPLIEERDIKRLRHLLEQSEKIAITCHIAPDGDAIGSSLGLAHVLRAIGKEVNIVTPDAPARNLMCLPGADDIVIFSRYEEYANTIFAQADLIFALDFNDLKRIDRLAQAFESAHASKVMIDHHLDPRDFADIKISFPKESSTSLLVFRTLCCLELFPYIEKDAATCLYTGMMTDTGNFSYNSNDPDIYIVISELIKKGINKDEIYSRIYNCNTADKMRLNGFAISERMRVYPEHRAALITLSRDDLNRFRYQRGYTEGLVNQPLTIPQLVYSFYIREEEDYIHISARSKGNFSVSAMCEQHYNGGGHKNAAGGKLFCSLDEAVALFESLLPEYDQYLPNNQSPKPL